MNQERLACLKLAVERGGEIDDILEAADRFWDFVTFGEARENSEPLVTAHRQPHEH